MADPNQQEFLLWLIKNKYNALADADKGLLDALSNPANDKVVIETRLDADNAERQLLLARYQAIAAGGNFVFPTADEIQKLRAAIADLETAVAQSAAVTGLIQAASNVASLVKSTNM